MCQTTATAHALLGHSLVSQFERDIDQIEGGSIKLLLLSQRLSRLEIVADGSNKPKSPSTPQLTAPPTTANRFSINIEEFNAFKLRFISTNILVCDQIRSLCRRLDKINHRATERMEIKSKWIRLLNRNIEVVSTAQKRVERLLVNRSFKRMCKLLDPMDQASRRQKLKKKVQAQNMRQMLSQSTKGSSRLAKESQSNHKKPKTGLTRTKAFHDLSKARI